MAKPRRSKRVGMSRVHLVRGGSAAGTRAIEVTCTAARRRRRRSNQTTHHDRDDQQRQQRYGQLKVMGGGSREWAIPGDMQTSRRRAESPGIAIERARPRGAHDLGARCATDQHRHQTSLPIRTPVSSAPTASSTSATAMNPPASGTSCLVTVSRRSMVEATSSSCSASRRGGSGHRWPAR